MNGARLRYSGGTAVGTSHEKYLLGTSSFTGTGYIKMIFSDGWSKYNLVKSVPGTTTFLTFVPTATAPGLLGFEVVGEITITGGEMILPDARATANQPLTFKVGEGAKLTIAQGAILKTEDKDGQAAANITKIAVADRANVEVAGQLWIPVGAAPNQESVNNGTITVTETGILQKDLTAAPTLATINGLTYTNNGTIVIKGGGKVLYNRALYPAQPVFLGSGPAATVVQTTGKADITITAALLKVSGSNVSNDKVTIKGATPTVPGPIQVDKADVTVIDVLTGTAATNETVTLTSGAKMTFKKVPAATIDGLTATGGSEVVLEQWIDTATAVITPIELNGSTATYIHASVGTTAPVDFLPVGVTATNATINYRGLGATAFLPTKVIGGPEISKFTIDKDVVAAAGLGAINIVGGTAEFGGALDFTAATTPALNVSAKGNLKVGGLLTLVANSTFTVNDSTASLASFTSLASTMTLSAGSAVTLSGTGTYTGAGTITFSDAASTFKGTTTGVSKLVGNGAAITITAPDNAALGNIAELETTETGASKTIASTKSSIWNGTKWGLAQ